MASSLAYSENIGSKLGFVNRIIAKELEERYMRWLDKLGGDSVGPTPVCDAHMVALARTNVQQGTMWAVRAIFPPIRINLPEGGDGDDLER